MFNAILLGRDAVPTEEQYVSAIESVVGDTQFNVDWSDGGAMVSIGGRVYSILYINQPIPNVNKDYQHQAHLIISTMDKGNSIREGVPIQMGVLRVCLMLMIEFDEHQLYWSNTKKVCNSDMVQRYLAKYNDYISESKNLKSDILPLSHWIAVEENVGSIKINGFSGLYEKDIVIKNILILSKDNCFVDNLIRYIFDFGCSFRLGDTVELLGGVVLKFRCSESYLYLE